MWQKGPRAKVPVRCPITALLGSLPGKQTLAVDEPRRKGMRSTREDPVRVGRVVELKGRPHTVPGKTRRDFDLVVSFVDQPGGSEGRLVLGLEEDQTGLLGGTLQVLGLAKSVQSSPPG